jgi:hypothetical protein
MTTGPIADPPPIPVQLTSAIPAGRASDDRIPADTGMFKMSAVHKKSLGYGSSYIIAQGWTPVDNAENAYDTRAY